MAHNNADASAASAPRMWLLNSGMMMVSLNSCSVYCNYNKLNHIV
jgi:hypothetical protein